ncbi:MAG TPA: peptidylprolyl isomerase, partial [Chloroflexota bacterium]|nr:peptidylprolyl isomerase [Chloroflexota bacterium]
METRSFRPKRSVRHAQAVAQQPPPPPIHHRHVTKHQRERRVQLLAIVGAVAIVLLIVLIPAYGYWREVIHLGDEPLVVVGGQTITGTDYARYLGTRQEILLRQVVQAQAAVPVPTGTPTTQPTANQAAAQQTLDTLSQEQSALSTTALTDLVEARLILNEARARGLTVSQPELDDAARWMLSPPALGLQQPSGLVGAPEPLTGPNRITADQAKPALAQIVGKGRYLTAAQVDDLILKPAVLKTKLLAAFGKDVPATSEQIHARHILVATEAQAASIRAQLEKGGDFTALAKQYSTDTGTKDQGGDLGWFGRGVMVPEFEQAAFSLKVGEIAQPVKTQFGYHIIQVLAKDPHRALDPTQLAQAKEQAYGSW